MAITMFDRYGGFASVRKVVSAFYDKVLESDLLQRHFENVDTRALIDHQTKFFAYLMGGPASFTDEALRRSHARLNITAEDFEEMGMLLEESLEDFDFEAADVKHVMAEIQKREPLIVSQARAA